MLLALRSTAFVADVLAVASGRMVPEGLTARPVKRLRAVGLVQSLPFSAGVALDSRVARSGVLGVNHEPILPAVEAGHMSERGTDEES